VAPQLPLSLAMPMPKKPWLGLRPDNKASAWTDALQKVWRLFITLLEFARQSQSGQRLQPDP
jgi:hypothetical protein